jgi:hypothetical protein
MVEDAGGLQNGLTLQQRTNGNVQALLIADPAGLARNSGTGRADPFSPEALFNSEPLGIRR